MNPLQWEVAVMVLDKFGVWWFIIGVTEGLGGGYILGLTYFSKYDQSNNRPP